MQAPEFSLTAIASEREIGVPQSLPAVLVLLFQDRNSADSARAVNRRLRERYEEADSLIVASVVNLKGVPRLMRPMAVKMMKGAYEEAAAEVPPQFDAADYILLLPDWTGRVSRLFDVPDVSQDAYMVIIDGEGQIAVRHQGRGDLARVARYEVDKLLADQP